MDGTGPTGAVDEQAIAAVEDRVAEVCGVVNAGHGALVTLAADALDAGLWQQWGIHSPAHWLAWKTGVSRTRARQLVRIASRRGDLPITISALAAGELSVDQAHEIARHVPAAFERGVVEFAKLATIAQLRRILPAYAWSGEPTPDGPIEEKRSASLTYDDDAQGHLHASLPTDEAALVDAALRAARDDRYRQLTADLPDDADRPTVTDADGLVAMAESYLDHGQARHPSGDRFLIHAHLDTGAHDAAGNVLSLHLGPVLPDHLRRLHTCDGTIRPVWEREGTPVNVGRDQRLVPRRARRVIEHRDGGCAVPGCDRRTGLQIHHIVHWEHGGPTDSANLITLCQAHHRKLHLGLLSIDGNPDSPAGVRFRDRYGRPLEPAGVPQPVGAATGGAAGLVTAAAAAGIAARPYVHPTGERIRGHWVSFFPDPPPVEPPPDPDPPPAPRTGPPTPRGEPSRLRPGRPGRGPRRGAPVTLPAVVDNAAWIERDAAVVWHGFTQMATYGDNRPVIVDRAEGRELIDVEGNRYLDAISSLWVTTLGHRVPELDQAVRDQLDRVAHSTMLGNGNRVVIELAEALAPRVPVDDPRFLFASDGSAAVEQAIKIAFQYWTNQGITTRTRYLSFGGAYHGDTIGSLSLGDGGFGTDVFDPLRFPVLRAPSLSTPEGVDAAVALLRTHGDELAAVVLEPLVQGAAGMALNPPAAVDAVARAAAEAGVLVIHDEVATGFGRTGTLFATDQCTTRPDLLVMGKGITGGYLPLSATVASRRVWDAFLGPDLSERTFYHGHSYSGNALAAAVALRHLELLDDWQVLDNVAARADQLGAALADRIAPSPAVAEVRRCGLMVGIELAPPTDGLRWGRRVSAGCVDRGVLVRPLGDVVVLMPPLTTTAAEIDRMVDAVAGALGDLTDVALEPPR